MEIKEIQKRAIEVRNLYDDLNRANGHKVWTLSELAMGLVVDIGDLLRQIMALEGLRSGDNAREKLEHELNDILLSVLCIAYRCGVDFDSTFPIAMDSLKNRIQKETPQI
jgi:NTP pyrophosphatase (non-canonical NTP hydrolase)